MHSHEERAHSLYLVMSWTLPVDHVTDTSTYLSYTDIKLSLKMGIQTKSDYIVLGFITFLANLGGYLLVLKFNSLTMGNAFRQKKTEISFQVFPSLGNITSTKSSCKRKEIHLTKDYTF